MGSQLTNATSAAGEDEVLDGLRRGLGRDGIPIPAYQTLGVEVREATAGAAVVPTAVPPSACPSAPSPQCSAHHSSHQTLPALRCGPLTGNPSDVRSPIIIVCGYCPPGGSNRTRSWITD